MIKYSEDDVANMSAEEVAQRLPDIRQSMKSWKPKARPVYDVVREDGHYSLAEMRLMPQEFVQDNLVAVNKSIGNPRIDKL